jgi:hypothetical protein
MIRDTARKDYVSGSRPCAWAAPRRMRPSDSTQACARSRCRVAPFASRLETPMTTRAGVRTSASSMTSASPCSRQVDRNGQRAPTPAIARQRRSILVAAGAWPIPDDSRLPADAHRTAIPGAMASQMRATGSMTAAANTGHAPTLFRDTSPSPSVARRRSPGRFVHRPASVWPQCHTRSVPAWCRHGAASSCRPCRSWARD